MTRETWWVLKKDLYAARYELIVYVLAALVVEANLAFLWWPGHEIPWQILLWAFIGFVFARACREDRLAPRDTCWWATRPLSPEHVKSAKFWFSLVAVIGPLFAIRVGLALYARFDPVSALTVATLGVLPVALAVLAVMGKYWKTFDGWRMGVILVIVLAGCFLELVNDEVSHSTDGLELQALNPGTPAPAPTSVLDAWLAAKLPDNRVILESSFQSEFDLSGKRYRISGKLSGSHPSGLVKPSVGPRTWYWSIKNQNPAATVRAEQVESPLLVETQKRRVVSIQGERHVQYVSTSLPEPPDGKKLHYEGEMEWKVAEIHRVWEGAFAWGTTQVDQGIPARILMRPNGKVDIQFLGPVTAGIAGDKAFLNWFGAGAAVTVSSREGRNIAVFTPGPQIVDAGWPGFSRRYRLRIPDPRRYFPEGTPLEVKVYSANCDGEGRSQIRGTVRPPVTRSNRPEGCFEGGHVLKPVRRVVHGEPGERRPDVASGAEGGEDPARKGLGAEIDQKVRKAFFYGGNLALEKSWDRMRERFDAGDSDQVRAVIDRLHWHPQMFTWLPDDAQKEGRIKLRGLLSSPPITNPVGMLKLAETIEFEDEKSHRGLAWCFVHSDRLDRIFSEIEHRSPWRQSHGARCSVRYLDIIPEANRSAAWEETWGRVKLEVAMDSRVKTPPDYITEALRRGSPDAVRVARDFMQRVGPASKIRDETTREHYYRMLEVLRPRTDYTGPPEEFESWFMRHGMDD